MNNMVNVPYVHLEIDESVYKEKLLSAVNRVLGHGKYILGPEVEVFEERFARYCGAKYALGVDNGTNAIILSLLALGIGPGDEVITAPNSFLASASSVALVGATPVFADVRDDFNIDPEKIKDAITPRTKAIIPVHLTGRPAEMDAILEIANQHNLKVIEDCAQSVGAAYKGRRVGSYGDIGCFSLHPLKNLAAGGDGGVITTNDEETYMYLLKARNHGLRNRDECDFWSFNSRLDTIQAAMLLVKMDYLNEWTEKRRDNALYYRERLEKVVKCPEDSQDYYSVYHTFIIQAPKRDQLLTYLESRGIGSKVHYPIPIHLQKAASGLGYGKGSFPKTEAQAETILSLPVYPELSIEQREYVVSSILSFYEK
jgi:dTDP-4-amino-4,6-dideoxygalactose transaminase